MEFRLNHTSETHRDRLVLRFPRVGSVAAVGMLCPWRDTRCPVCWASTVSAPCISHLSHRGRALRSAALTPQSQQPPRHTGPCVAALSTSSPIHPTPPGGSAARHRNCPFCPHQALGSVSQGPAVAPRPALPASAGLACGLVSRRQRTLGRVPASSRRELSWERSVWVPAQRVRPVLSCPGRPRPGSMSRSVKRRRFCCCGPS